MCVDTTNRALGPSTSKLYWSTATRGVIAYACTTYLVSVILTRYYVAKEGYVSLKETILHFCRFVMKAKYYAPHLDQVVA